MKDLIFLRKLIFELFINIIKEDIFLFILNIGVVLWVVKRCLWTENE